MEYHITQFPPNGNWPEGGWSLYQITADQIAKRIVYDEKGNLVRRDSWSGYIGCFENLRQLSAAIAQHEQDNDR